MTEAESNLLHAAAGMDLFRPLEKDGTLLFSPIEYELVDHLLHLGCLEVDVFFSVCKITERGIVRLNEYIGS